MTPKWHRTLQGQKYPIDVLLVFSSPKFLSFRSTTIFQSQANDSEWLHLLLLHYKVICTRYLQLCATSVTVPRFQSISLYCQLLCRFSPFWKCSEWPQIILNAMRSNVPHIHVCSINTPEPQSATWFVQWSVIFELPRPFWNKCTEWPQNNLEQYKAKGTLKFY